MMKTARVLWLISLAMSACRGGPFPHDEPDLEAAGGGGEGGAARVVDAGAIARGGRGGGTGGAGGKGGSGGTPNAGGRWVFDDGWFGKEPPDAMQDFGPPIAHFTFEEGTGNKVEDDSGNANHAVIVRGESATAAPHDAPLWVDGRAGKGLKLNGLDEWVRVPDSPSLDRTAVNNAISLAAWVKIDGQNDRHGHTFVVHRDETGPRREQFGLGLFQGLPMGAVHFNYVAGPQEVPLGEWVHLAQTYDGTTQRVYMNGTEVASLDIGWPIAARDTVLTIGAALDEAKIVDNVTGTIDEVRVYDRELTASEVETLAR